MVTMASDSALLEARSSDDPKRLGWIAKSRVKRPRWHLIYYLLAGFDILTVSGSLYLNHEIMAIYSGSVEVNQLWADRLGRFDQLRNLTIRVNAPGNDVFDSHDVVGEHRKQGAALKAFDRQLASTNQEIVANVSLDKAAPLLTGLSVVETAMADMVAEAELIFSYFRANETEKAGRRMATMDRKYARLSIELNAAAQKVRAIQARHFAEQIAEAAFLRRFEFIIGGFIALMVCFVTVYGHKIAKNMKSSEEERAALTNQLRQAQKMESLGTLAGGIAHEFNNMLVPITGLAEMAMRDLSSKSRTRENMKMILEVGNRAARLVQKILSFSRIDDADYVALDLSENITEAINLLEMTVLATVNVRVAIDSQVGIVKVDPTQLHQVLINLVSNAVDAMDETTGQLTVRLSRVEIDAVHAARNTDLRAGSYGQLTVSDTGTGMDKATMARVFDPFFTTKKVGQGTGMGLAIIHGIVAALQGAVEVTSEVGIGTTFDIFLPIVPPEEGGEGF